METKNYSKSLEQYINEIITLWMLKGFKYHRGHVLFLKYSYYTVVKWQLRKGKKVDKKIIDRLNDFSQYSLFPKTQTLHQLSIF